MKPGNAIEVKNVKKKFKVYFDKGSQLKERILFRNRNRYEERWVLDDVSFEVKQGEAIVEPLTAETIAWARETLSACPSQLGGRA